MEATSDRAEERLRAEGDEAPWPEDLREHRAAAAGAVARVNWPGQRQGETAMRILGCAAATALLLLVATVTRAEEFRGVDPKQVVDGDNFYVSIRLSGIDA